VKIGDTHYRTIWLHDDGWSVAIIDQTRLPHELRIVTLTTVEEAAEAIRTMRVRGAPLIGAMAAYGVCLAVRRDPSDRALTAAVELLSAARPTAVNLRWALTEMVSSLSAARPADRVAAAYERAAAICDEDVAICRRIGQHGLVVLTDLAGRTRGRRINVLTHCNAGWLATVDWGTALAPVYMAHDAGLDVHVWVDETRPRSQGAALTAYELGAHGVPHTVVVDNAGGHLMQHGMVDVCIVGTDRTTRTGDVANKIGTYLKALAARDNAVPFYVALPHPTIDWAIRDGVREIPIEQRDPAEVLRVTGRASDGRVLEVEVAAPGSPAANFAFDVTPARFVTGLITDRGVCEASEAGLTGLFPDLAAGG
jgi:methylthioribose-1-phosphate isomerase